MKNVSFVTQLVVLPLYILPRPLKRLTAHGITLFWVYVLKLRCKETEARIAQVLGHLTKQQQRQIMYRSFYNLILVLIEYSYFPFQSRKGLKYCQIQGEEHLKAALAEGKGVLILAAHVGNGEMGVHCTCLKGYPLHLIAKRVGVGFLDKLLFEIREASGLVHFAPKKSMESILHALSQGLPVLYLQDQFRHPPKGIPSTFLGVPTYTNSSLAYLAIKSGAVVLTANVHRGEKDISILEFGERVHTEMPFKELESNIAYMTQKYNSAVENYIYKYPQDWMWVHRRWKRQPKEAELPHFSLAGWDFSESHSPGSLLPETVNPL